MWPFKMIKHWWICRKEAKLFERYKEGFDWAAGCILREEMTIEEVESFIYFEFPVLPNEYDDEFDKGAKEAIQTIMQMKSHKKFD